MTTEEEQESAMHRHRQALERATVALLGMRAAMESLSMVTEEVTADLGDLKTRIKEILPRPAIEIADPQDPTDEEMQAALDASDASMATEIDDGPETE